MTIIIKYYCLEFLCVYICRCTSSPFSININKMLVYIAHWLKGNSIIYLLYLPSHKSHVFAHFFATQFLEHLPLFFHFLHFLAFAVSLQISSSFVHSPQVLGHFLTAQFLEHLPFESHFWHCFLLAMSSQPKNTSLLVEKFFYSKQ